MWNLECRMKLISVNLNQYMSINTDNIIVKKSYAFALEIIKLYKYLIEQKEFVLSKQIMRSGTSIGANIHEGVVSESKKILFIN